MVITKLEGGLGNQMFQYAAGKALAVQNKDTLLLDTSIFLYLASDPKVTKYKYALGVFPAIKDRFANIFDLKLLTPMMIPQLSYLWERLYLKYKLGKIKVFREKEGFSFDQSVFRQKNDIYLLGFWQNGKYLSHYEKELRKIFTFSPSIAQRAQARIDKIPIERRVAIHVRRGDYLKIGLGACGLDYYKNAVNVMKQKVKNPYFIVVSNDIEWTRRNLSFLKNALFIDPKDGDEATDLCILSKCSHNIIANSTFSWWGAWLNSNKRKIVIAPKPWFDWESFNGKSPVLSDWILLLKSGMKSKQ